MKKTEEKLEIRNQWLAGWNYGWLNKKEKEGQVEEWYQGYKSGSDESQKKIPTNTLEKKILDSL